jgi:hypothetical protein
MTMGSNRVTRQAVALLCVALLLVFGQAAVASNIAAVQHLVAGHHAHQHMLFADVTPDFDHHDTDHDTGHDADRDMDHHDGKGPPGHHHHNGDLGSASVVLVAAGSVLVRDWQSADPPQRGRTLIMVRRFLPERPPRTNLILT